MNICFVHDRFKGIGGVERHFVNLANELITRGHNIEIVCLDNFYDNFLTNSLSPKIKKTALRVPRVLGFIPLYFHFRKNKTAYDAVLSIKTYVDMMTIPCHKLSGSTAKLYCTIVTLLGLQKKHETNFIHKIALRIIYFFCRHLYPYTNSLIVLSQDGVADIKEFLCNKNLPQINIIYLAMIADNDITKTYPAPSHFWFNKLDNSNQSPIPIIVACGRLCAAKNFSLLIDAFRIVRNNIPARLMILGNGELADDLKKQVKDYGLEQDVSFTGAVNNPECYFAHSDLYVLTSAYEGFGIVLAEAIAAGIPIITSDRTPIAKEMPDFYKYHRVAQDYSAQGFAECILEQLRLSPSYETNKIRAQAEQFTIANSARLHEQLFAAD